MSKLVARPCDGCPLRVNCTKACAALESLLVTGPEYETVCRVSKPTKSFLRELHERIGETRLMVSWRGDLAPEERAIFNARYNDGLSVRAAQHRFRCHSKTLHARFRRALMRIGDLAMGADDAA